MTLSTFALITSLCTFYAQAIRLPEPTSAYPGVNFFGNALLPFAAVYNGSLTFNSLEAGQPCGSTGTFTNYTLFLGPQDARKYQDKEYKRSVYDTNPFWLRLDNDASMNVRVFFTSSTGGFNNTSNGPAGWQHWNLTSDASGDGWDFSGKFANNEYGNAYTLDGCDRAYINWPLGSIEGWTMKGHVSPSKASFTVTLPDWQVRNGNTRHWDFKFEGTWDGQAGTKLVAAGSTFNTEGINKRIAMDANGQLLDQSANTTAKTSNGLVGQSLSYSWGSLLFLGVVSLVL